MYPFSRLVFLNKLTFLNTCGGLKVSGKIMWDDRGVVEFEFAAHTAAKRPTQVAMWFNDLILKKARSEDSRSR